VHHCILGFHVAMNNPLSVCVVERGRHVVRVCDCFVDWYLTESIQRLSKRFTLDIRHDVIQKSINSAGVEQRQNVRMIQSRGCLYLAEKPLCSERFGYVRVKYLECDETIVPEILREINSGRSTTPKLAIDRVRGVERVAQSSSIGWHSRRHRNEYTVLARKLGVY